ncbi:bifunctional precorrin-2 dehydrogenase/sirohydrochlorin ferrochelatase [Bacillus sp. EAC]|uniref:precorrin-2 dehydrogenase/sirohydrochlorin ferrochelatase family protein n=1 Tax=Bacillus sp. EAC TaxID=1978338 RepID=UPI000B436B12|nr:NAD(P)-dependent oxidoreductase [Bacillus sp. EAC]
MSDMVPLLFSFENKRIVIIGGGKIAFRKAKSFVKSGATITIISPEIVEEFNEFPSILWIKKHFEKEDITNAHVIIAATDDQKVNNYIKECTSDFQWFSDVSDQNKSDFHTPAVVRRGDLVISISTSGKSPILSKKIKHELENYFDDHFFKIVNDYGEQRKKPGKQ